MRWAAALSATILFLAAACGGREETWTSPLAFDTAGATVLVHGDSVPVLVELAVSEEQRQFGLSRRPSLDPGSGMAFLFDSIRAPDQGFWMWRTVVPLDIAFLDGEDVIRSILSMDPCADAIYARACPVYEPGVEYQWALEVNQGWFEEHGVEVGDTVRLDR
jgi:uncharacterized membrane protein (UPF0127 family)